MIVCPNCNHQNPEGAAQCEACYTPLPVMTACPNCGTVVQTDANFCGQCGLNLRVGAAIAPIEESAGSASIVRDENAPELAAAPLVAASSLDNSPGGESNGAIAVNPAPLSAVAEQPTNVPTVRGQSSESQTQLQQISAKFIHLRTNTVIELPTHVSVIHIGKPNDRIPPNIDVSGFPDSEIVSRIHADIRVEGDAYYIEDVGSSNGTYINSTPLLIGNRHRLRAGDRVSLGKGDRVTFLFQLS